MNKRILEVNGMKWIMGVTDKKGMPAGPGPSGLRFEHRLMINAPAKSIWKVLSDVNRWNEWSVLYPAASGELSKGNVINITIYVPHTKAIPSTAEVKECEPEKFVMFKSVTKLPGFFMNGMRYFQIETVDDNHCVVCDGEVVGGVLGIVSAAMMPRNLFEGLKLMNEGLKRTVENAVGNINDNG